MDPLVESTTPAFHPYSLLPCELQLPIIEQFLLDQLGGQLWALDYPLNTVTRRPLAQYATVNLQWKSAVEKLTFRSLQLRIANPYNHPNINNRNDLDSFERICVGDRINFVSRICLSISLQVQHIHRTELPPNTFISWRDDESKYVVDDEDTHPSTLSAGLKATEAFRRLFRMLQNWSRDGPLLGLTYELDRRYPHGLSCWLGHPRWGTHLRIDSSTLPEVACIGSLRAFVDSGWSIQPASACQLLMKLPNVTHADMDLQERLELPEMVEMLEEGKSTLSLRGPRLEHLSMYCTEEWCGRLGQESSGHSLQFNQCIYGIASRLEELRLKNVVNVPYFLRESCGANGSTPQSVPAWPKLRKLWVGGYTSKETWNDGAVAEETYDSITHALPQMPNLTNLELTTFSEYHGLSLGVRMQLPPQRDRSAMPDAVLCWEPMWMEPDAGSIDTWRMILRSHWHCRLVSDPQGCQDHRHWGLQSTNSHRDPLGVQKGRRKYVIGL